METVKLNREFIEAYYKCPKMAKFLFLKKPSNLNKKINKLSCFTEDNYKLMIYSKIMNYVFYKFIDDKFCDFNEVASVASLLLKNNLTKYKDLKNLENINLEILSKLNLIFKMFDKEDVLNCVFKTVKDNFLINNLIGDLISQTKNKEKINIKILNLIKQQYIYEIQIPFITNKFNNAIKCSPIFFVYQDDIRKISFNYNIDFCLSFLYVLENSKFLDFEEIIIYNFKTMERVTLKTSSLLYNKGNEILKIISQLEFGLCTRTIDENVCNQCFNLEACNS